MTNEEAIEVLQRSISKSLYYSEHNEALNLAISALQKIEKDSHNCGNCKYQKLHKTTRPCSICYAKYEWRPKDDE